MMKPGSREKNTPGSFREEVAPMYYNKKPMNFNGKDKKQKGDIVPMTNEMKKAAKKGAPDGSSKTGDLYAGAKSRAAKPKSNFRPIITGNRVYDKKSINKAFESRFGKPKKKNHL